eukprot:TRINITY_DN73561_c0_g1_i1.p1 TRINITY_DN73561_c0_g1~~TRINITY_DN73561_c0_g1_i1.p1  ORF type:complete len:1091 (-),score=223.38 TRINITY_DN73561_c0_g1_i1:254-3481(-)
MATAASRTVARATLQHLLEPPVRLSEKEQRQAAFGILQRFARLSEEAFGCKATSNRVHVRRAVFHAAKDQSISAFVEDRLNGDVTMLHSLARLPCPVTIPDKTMLKTVVPESTPKRVIFASKALRRHFSLPETTSCRSCDKRSRCRWFKAPALEDVSTDLGHVVRVLFGMWQYARAHLRHPEAYPFYFQPVDLKSAEAIMDALTAHMQENLQHMLYSKIEIADEETASELLLKQAKKKLELQQAQAEEKLLALPQWMRETMRPAPGKHLRKAQRELIQRQSDIFPLENEDNKAAPKEKDEVWFEEGALPGEFLGEPLAADPAPLPGDSRSEESALAGPVTVVDAPEDLPVPRRFWHVKRSPKDQQYGHGKERVVANSDDVGEFSHLNADQLAHRVDLDREAGTTTDANRPTVEALLWEAAEPQTSPRGGYSIVNLLNKGTYLNVPEEALSFVSVPHGSLEGVHVYHDVLRETRGRSDLLLDPSVLEELWGPDGSLAGGHSGGHPDSGASRGGGGQDKDELPFLNRVPFDSGVGHSGGALPYARLPREMLLAKPAPVKPAPQRHQLPVDIGRGDLEREGQRDASGASAASGMSPRGNSDAELRIVELDVRVDSVTRYQHDEAKFVVTDTSNQHLFDDAEKLAARALAAAAEESAAVVAAGGPQAWQRRMPLQAATDNGSILDSSAGPDDADSARLAAWSARAQVSRSLEAESEKVATPQTEGESTEPAVGTVKGAAHDKSKRQFTVLQPAVDITFPGDSTRLDRISRRESEPEVVPQERRRQPHDEAFISTFRRPLQADTEGDPLGVAAPSVDIRALKAADDVRPDSSETSQAKDKQLSEVGLEEDSRYVMGGSLKFPKLPEVTATPMRRPPASASSAATSSAGRARVGGAPFGGSRHPDSGIDHAPTAAKMAQSSSSSSSALPFHSAYFGGGGGAPASSAGTAAAVASPTPTSQKSPIYRRLRQARTPTDLDDLLRPVEQSAPTPARGRGLGGHGKSGPGNTQGIGGGRIGEVTRPDDSSGSHDVSEGMQGQAQTTDTLRQNRNASIAMQQMLLKEQANQVVERFPNRRNQRQRR